MRKWDKNERRFDRYGEFRLLAAAEGYVLFRRKGCVPGVMPIDEWDALARWSSHVGETAFTINLVR